MRATAARLFVAVLPAMVAGCGSGAESAKTCDVEEPLRITGNGIGALRIGATVEALRQRCDVLADTTVSLGKEGMPERRVTVVVGPATAAATISDGRVWRVEIATPRLRSRDSLGVGSTMRDLRASDARVSAGEHGAYVVRADHCGLSFQLPGVVGSPALRASDIPDTATVGTVLVVGCSDTRLD